LGKDEFIEDKNKKFSMSVKTAADILYTLLRAYLCGNRGEWALMEVI
jgi:hypothetical protein